MIPFDAENESLLSSFASQAAVALENSFLIESIENLFDGFIKASVVAIESRDPSTSGHSERVAMLSLKLAEAVNETTTGNYADVYFDENQLKEIKFAGMLHDFGKVAIKENILVKQNKIFEYQAELLKWRIELFKRIYEVKMLNAMIKNCLDGSFPMNETSVSALKEKIQTKQAEIENLYTLIQEAAQPKPLKTELINEIASYKNIELQLTNGDSYPLITENDFEDLSISRGTLNKKEKIEVESHVEHTFKFLKEIPWTKELEKIPEIAGGHHEKLNGKGYPEGKTDTEILIQSKIMAVADIFDALTATDRPYSNGLSVQQAIEILREEAAQNQIDSELVEIFAKTIITSRNSIIKKTVNCPDAEIKVNIESNTHYKDADSDEDSDDSLDLKKVTKQLNKAALKLSNDNADENAEENDTDEDED